jgi:hypothetical protein
MWKASRKKTKRVLETKEKDKETSKKGGKQGKKEGILESNVIVFSLMCRALHYQVNRHRSWYVRVIKKSLCT